MEIAYSATADFLLHAVMFGAVYIIVYFASLFSSQDCCQDMENEIITAAERTGT